MRIAAIRDSVHQGDAGKGLVLDVPDGIDVPSAVGRFVDAGYLPKVRSAGSDVGGLGTWSVWSGVPIAVLAEGWGPELLDLNLTLKECTKHNGVALFAFAYHGRADAGLVKEALYVASCALKAGFVRNLNPFFLKQRRSMTRRSSWKVGAVVLLCAVLAAAAVVFALDKRTPIIGGPWGHVLDNHVRRIAKNLREQVRQSHALPDLRGLEGDMVDLDGHDIVVEVTKDRVVVSSYGADKVPNTRDDTVEVIEIPR